MSLAVLHGAAADLVMVLAGIAAGLFNGVAGGGTLVSFPVLLAMGLPALTANVTNSVGVLPSYVGGIAAFRTQLSDRRRLLRALAPAGAAGALVGTALLLGGTPSTFRSVVPWLVGLATVAFAAQPAIIRAVAHVPHDHPTRRALLHAGTFAVAVYGGYFGAGLGIMLLAVWGLALPDDLSTLSGLRNAASILINAVAATVFVLRGELVWGFVVCLWAGTLLGGFAGAALVVRLRPGWFRAAVVLIGAATTVRLVLA